MSEEIIYWKKSFTKFNQSINWFIYVMMWDGVAQKKEREAHV